MDPDGTPHDRLRVSLLGIAGALLMIGCGDSVYLEADEGPALEVAITDCRVGAVRFAGEVDGQSVAADWCLQDSFLDRWRGPFFAMEASFDDDDTIGPALLAEGEKLEELEDVVADLHRAVVGWPAPLWSPGTAPLCAGPGSWFVQRKGNRHTPEVPYHQTHLEGLSRLMACQPGNETVQIDYGAFTATGSLDGGFEAGVVFAWSSGRGEFRILLDNGAYVYARLTEPWVTEAGMYPEARDYEIAEAFAWYHGEFFCSGRGTVAIEDDGERRYPVVSVEGLGSAGTCPGRPVDGELDVFRLEGHRQWF